MDFPKFVTDLVQGVFEAIVDATIRQVQAYAELLSDIAQAADSARHGACPTDERDKR